MVSGVIGSVGKRCGQVPASLCVLAVSQLNIRKAGLGFFRDRGGKLLPVREPTQHPLGIPLVTELVKVPSPCEDTIGKVERLAHGVLPPCSGSGDCLCSAGS